MKSYELSIETKQPTCGGKSPTKVELLEVKLDDPLAFVRSREADLPLLTEQSPDGDLVVRVETEKRIYTSDGPLWKRENGMLAEETKKRAERLAKASPETLARIAEIKARG